MQNKPLQQWDAAAEAYEAEQQKSAYARCNFEIVARRFTALPGAKVLDAPCGGGRFSKYFSSVGAQVTGCDGSQQMLRHARQAAPGCRFDCTDLTKPLPYQSGEFELVFCNLVLMDLDPIDGLLAGFYRVLRPGGLFYVSLVHPAFFGGSWEMDAAGKKVAKCISRYRTSYRYTNRFWGETAQFHRPLSFYFNLAACCGFSLKSVQEPQSEDDIIATGELPLFLFLEYEKPAQN